MKPNVLNCLDPHPQSFFLLVQRVSNARDSWLRAYRDADLVPGNSSFYDSSSYNKGFWAGLVFSASEWLYDHGVEYYE